ncbi:uncharacterized protein LOC126614571 [Malus sylvestris]|uniref:uncharacterized protein LOC126614571 n=1 Tax=Malus sylvestris TaxID=3752 RepID=UPI0021AC89DD|nr:uncharacterized protein LOC126614571 [Malus sylvestris]
MPLIFFNIYTKKSETLIKLLLPAAVISKASSSSSPVPSLLFPTEWNLHLQVPVFRSAQYCICNQRSASVYLLPLPLLGSTAFKGCKMEWRQSSESTKPGNENNSSYSLGTIVVGVAAGISLMAWGLSALVSSAGEKKKKTMKAPGKDKIINREEFARDPKGYFRGLRKK